MGQDQYPSAEHPLRRRIQKSAETGQTGQKGQWEHEPPSRFGPNAEYIGEKNTKIYYFPDSPELERIPEAQLIKFSSRVEAKAAGYRACHSCHESSGDPEE